MTVVAFVPDLIDRSRISAALPGARFVATPADLAGVEAGATVLVDLSRPGVVEVIPQVKGRIVGFASHVDTELIERARAAGCALVLPRSRFFRELAGLI